MTGQNLRRWVLAKLLTGQTMRRTLQANILFGHKFSRRRRPEAPKWKFGPAGNLPPASAREFGPFTKQPSDRRNPIVAGFLQRVRMSQGADVSWSFG